MSVPPLAGSAPPPYQANQGYGTQPVGGYGAPPMAGAYGPGPPAGAVPGGMLPPAGAVPSYQQHGVVVTTQAPVTQVVMVGGCPACRVGMLQENFTLLGVCCAILFFPIGLLCCLAMRQKRCTNCGALFG